LGCPVKLLAAARGPGEAPQAARIVRVRYPRIGASPVASIAMARGAAGRGRGLESPKNPPG
jgi:hypothetical protein